jgi:cell division protein FtsQ
VSAVLLRATIFVVVIAACVTLLLTFSGLFGTQKGRLLQIHEIHISGEFSHLNDQQIRAAAAPYCRANFFRVSTVAVRDAVEALPWVARADVRKIWPNAIAISVRERIAFARYGERELLATDGAIFQSEATAGFSGLPQLNASAADRESVVRFYRAAHAQLATKGLDIGTATLSERGGMVLSLTNGVKILLGRDDISTRWARFFNALDALMQSAPGRVMQSVDLRYSNGLAVTYASPPPTESFAAALIGDAHPVPDLAGTLTP